jgi:hypothetical protein
LDQRKHPVFAVEAHHFKNLILEDPEKSKTCQLLVSAGLDQGSSFLFCSKMASRRNDQI